MPTLATAKRYRLAVPAEDESVHKWIESQLNMSVSLRQLIREDIKNHGYSDVTCRVVEQGAKRGRPVMAESTVSESYSVPKQHRPVVSKHEDEPAVRVLQPQPKAKTSPKAKSEPAIAEPTESIQDIQKPVSQSTDTENVGYQSALESLMM